MATKYAKHVGAKATPQSEPIPGSKQVQNSAGGYSFEVDDFTRVDRFLVLGAEGGSYYASERKLTKENAQAVMRAIKADGPEVVRRIVAVSDEGRAPKNSPAVFALSLAASFGDAKTRAAAYDALPKVCRTGTHLFEFAAACNEMRGWGRGLRRAVADWYLGKDPAKLAYQVTKYQQRDGWSHRDLLRLSHPKAAGLTNDVLHWAVKGWPGVGDAPHPEPALQPIWAFERAKRATTEREVVVLIRDYNLVRECVPTQFLNSPAVWEALLENMPVTAMVRNLGKMTAVGLLAPLSDAARKVADALGSEEVLRKGRVHPLNLLVAQRTYVQGHGDKGSLKWTPVGQVVDALDEAFYAAFKAVEPTGKRWMLALDVSGSMSAPVAGVANVSCRDAAAAMALVTAAVEPQRLVVGFTSSGWTDGRASQWAHMGYRNGLSPLDVSPYDRLADVVQKTSGLPFGGTDCALPMLYASANNLKVDVFAVYTDSETWAGSVHPVQALKQYREKTGIPARLVVVGMASNGFSIADPNDAGMLDVVGFDTAAPAVMADFARG